MKKMKTILIVKILVLTIILTGCTEYLNTQPYSFDTVDKLYQSEEGAELGLTGCYNTLNAETVQGTAWGGSFHAIIPFMLNGGTDEVVTRDGVTDPYYAPYGNYTYSSQSPSLKSNWFVLFAGINRTNYLLEKIDGVEMEEERKAEMKAEAHFLRGFFYFYLSIAYGALPIYKESEQSASAPRESVQEVYQLIIDDLKYAYENLEKVASKPGRADKWSAAGYLAKVYTYLASCKMNNVGADLNFELNSFAWVDANAMYREALKVTNDIIDNSDRLLTENYDYLFRETTGAWQEEESLFSLQGSKSVSNGNYNLLVLWQIPIGAPSAGAGFGLLRPTGEIYHKYHTSDIRRSHNLTQYLQTSNPTENIEGVNYFIPVALNSPLEGGYCVGKYRYRDAAEKDITITRSDGDIILLRYADILFLNAEALYFTGKEQQARERVNEVLTRVAESEYQLETLSDAYYNEDFITELLDSRARELCFEGWRRIDLIRFGKLAEAVNSLDPGSGFWNSIVPELKANWETYKIWFPIPKTEIELSPMLQNPGYN